MSLLKKGVAILLSVTMAVLAVPMQTMYAVDNNTEIKELKVNYSKNPIGIDKTPYFSWKMISSLTGQKQKAYKIIVKDDADTSVWDTGKVQSDISVGIKYEGVKLSPSTRYSWTVTAWDKDDNPITSTENAFFETGLLSATPLSDAEWLKVPDDNSETDNHFSLEYDMTFLQDAVGIVFSAKDSSNFIMWQFNSNNHITNNVRELYLRPHFWVNGKVTAYEININDKLTEADILNKKVRVKIDVTETKITTYVNDVLINEYDYNGATVGKIGFRACHDNTNNERGYIDNLVYKSYDNQNNATVLMDESFNSNPFSGGTIVNGQLSIEQAMNQTNVCLSNNADENGIKMFRKSFNTADKQIKSAKIYSTALGVYELFYNGNRVGTKGDDGKVVYDELKPGWTDYHDRVLYNTYDVTDLTTQNSGNTLLSMVAGGWWHGAITANKYGTTDYGNVTEAFKAKLVITYNDGTQDIINSDNSWKCLTGGPVRFADIYDGETYNANFENTEVYQADFDDSSWKTPAYSTDFKGVISANTGTNVRVKEELELSPETVVIYDGTIDNQSDFGKINIVDDSYKSGDEITIEAGKTAIIDFGQNHAGRPAITLNAPKNTRLTINFAEMLNDSGKRSRGNDGAEGSLYTANYRTALSKNTYIACGNGDETYRALFTFFGYRYISITASEDIVIKNLISEVLGSDIEETGTITTSDSSVNQLISNIMWGQRSNYFSTATDCPQRDERLGWTGDTGFFVGAASFNADVSSFFIKWMQDCSDSQQSNGAYTDTVPITYVKGSGNTAWADAGIIVPYTMYKMYGNKSLLTDNYSSMQKYMNFLAGRDYQGANTGYGDWLSYESTDGAYISMAYYAYVAQMMKEISQAIGQTNDTTKYTTLYNNIKKEFNKKYVSTTGRLNVTSQTAYLLALKIGLLPNEESVKLAKDSLLKKIKANGNKLSTGFIGTATIAQTLGDIGENNMAYTLLLQRGNPSWLYSVDQGATTVWERWNSYTKETGFGDVGMNSFNHYSFGAVAEWMYRYMAGIDTDITAPAFKTFKLQPEPDTRKEADIPSNQNKITSVSAEYNSMYGVIKSSWKTTDGVFDYAATVPANSTASLKLPVFGEYVTSLYLNGTEVNIDGAQENQKLSDGITYIGRDNSNIYLELDSGSYTIKEGKDLPRHLTGINLEKPSASVIIGNSVDIMATPVPTNTTDDIAFTYSSSNNTVATVDNKGKVNALSVGTAIITVTSVIKPDIKALFTVTVMPKSVPKNGWILKNNKYYYYKNDVLIKNQWIESIYRTDSSGARIVNKVVKISGKYYAFLSSGKVCTKTGWTKIGKDTYYIKKKVVQTDNLIKVSKKYYIVNSKGVKQLGTKLVSLKGKQYAIKRNVVQQNAWVKISNKYYRTKSSGEIIKGKTVKIGSNKYTFNKKGICTNK